MTSGWRAFAGLGLLLCALGLGSAAKAEIWVPAARGPDGAVFAIDAASAARYGAIEQSWVRQTLAHPVRDANARKSYLTELDQRFDDCQNRRYRIGEVTRRDEKGAVVSTGAVGVPWQDIRPESVAEGIWRVACRMGEKLPEQPYLANVGEGNWVRIGLSADQKYYMSVRMDRAVKLDDTHAVALSRSDYIDFDLLHGYPVKYVITANLVDCAHSFTALMGVDTYMTADVRAESYRVQSSAAKFEPIAPGSFLAGSVGQICAAAVSPPGDRAGSGQGDSDKEDSGTRQASSEPTPIGSGTAWATTKGYLVTASHVVEGGDKFYVYRDGQPIGLADVVADDRASDLAILKLKPIHPGVLAALPIAAHGAPLGQQVFALGYPEPQALGQQVKMTTGVVSGTLNQDDARMLQISAPLQPGNSGGPIIDWDGAVVGVADQVTTKFDDAPAQNVNFAVKSAYVRAMLEDLPDLGGYAYVKPAASQEALVSAARAAVFMVIVAK